MDPIKKINKNQLQKKRKINIKNTNPITIEKQYNALSSMNEDIPQFNSRTDKIPKLPLIFIYGVIN